MKNKEKRVRVSSRTQALLARLVKKTKYRSCDVVIHAALVMFEDKLLEVVKK